MIGDKCGYGGKSTKVKIKRSSLSISNFLAVWPYGGILNLSRPQFFYSKVRLMVFISRAVLRVDEVIGKKMHCEKHETI